MEMKEQELLEKIIGYFPYGLAWQVIETGTVFTPEGCLIIGNEIKFSGFGTSKPILYPLSSLTEKIKVNGEEFVPIEVLKNEFTGGGDGQELTFYSDGCFFYAYRKGIHCMVRQGEMIQRLYKWKFDIHGLIESGQAIDVTSLTVNPYD